MAHTIMALGPQTLWIYIDPNPSMLIEIRVYRAFVSMHCANVPALHSTARICDTGKYTWGNMDPCKLQGKGFHD